MYARVELIGSQSYKADGYPYFKRRHEVKFMTNLKDIAHFKAQPEFQVQELEDPVARRVALEDAKRHPGVKVPPPAPPEVKGEVKGEAKGEALPELEPKVPDYPPWSEGMTKAELLAAAEARDIAVTPQDKKASIIDLLRMHDEDHAQGKEE